mgnify:CR=1 FL=1
MKILNNIDFSIRGIYEYAFSSVPCTKRKQTWKIVIVMMCFAFSVSSITSGAFIGKALPFEKAILACLAGNFFLFCIGLLWGLLSYRFGYTSVFLVEKILGSAAGSIFSVLLVFSMVIWIGMVGDLFAKMVLSSFPKWPVPLSFTILMIVLFWVLCSIKGWKAMERIDMIVLPILFLLYIYHLWKVIEIKNGVQFLTEYIPKTDMTFFAAVTAVVGNFVIFTTTIPDVCRFAKSKKAVFLCVFAYFFTLMCSNFLGIFIIQAAQATTLNYAVLLLNIVLPYCIWLALCALTTQNGSIYVSSLAVQALVKKTRMGGQISHKTAVFFIGGLSVIVSNLKIMGSLLQMTEIFLLCILPLWGILFGAMLFYKKIQCLKNWEVVTAWIAGSVAGIIFYINLKSQFWVISLLVSAGVYSLFCFKNSRRMS